MIYSVDGPHILTRDPDLLRYPTSARCVKRYDSEPRGWIVWRGFARSSWIDARFPWSGIRLEPVELADSKRFAAHELREIEQIVQDRRVDFLEAWNEYFDR